MSNINSTWSDGQYIYRESRNCFSYCGQDLMYSMNMPACMRWVMFYVLWDSIWKHCLPNDSLIKKLKWKQGKERENLIENFFLVFLLQRGQKLSLTLKLDPSQTLQTFIFLFMIVRIVHELLQLHFDAIGFTQKSLRDLAYFLFPYAYISKYTVSTKVKGSWVLQGELLFVIDIPLQA